MLMFLSVLRKKVVKLKPTKLWINLYKIFSISIITNMTLQWAKKRRFYAWNTFKVSFSSSWSHFWLKKTDAVLSEMNIEPCLKRFFLFLFHLIFKSHRKSFKNLDNLKFLRISINLLSWNRFFELTNIDIKSYVFFTLKKKKQGSHSYFNFLFNFF